MGTETQGRGETLLPQEATPAATSSRAADDAPVIQVEGLHKRFGQKVVLDGVSLCVRRSEVLVILGPNGSGKSTLLRCINVLEPYQRGQVRLQGVVVSEGRPDGWQASRAEQAQARLLRRRVGMVFQRIHLFPHLTVLGNVMCGPRHVLGKSRQQARQIAREMLEKVGLWEQHPCDPAKLSGGQQQRVAIARSLAMNPDVLLFDECTSALDPLMTKEVLRVIRQLAAEGRTMLVVTHDLGFARDIADRILFMESGRVTAEGPADHLLSEPPTAGLRQFIEQEGRTRNGR